MSDAPGNGNGAHALMTVDQLTLTYDRVSDALNIEGRLISDEVAVAMLERAKRVFEGRIRLKMALEAQQAAAEAARTAAVLDNMRKGRG